MLDMLAEQRSAKCHGVDISDYAIARVREKGHDGRASRLPNIPYPDGVFDVAVCTETLEHVTEIGGTIAELRRVVRSRGKLLLSVPDGLVDEEEVHVHRFTVPYLRSVLERHFDVQYLEVIKDYEAPVLFVVAVARPQGDLYE